MGGGRICLHVNSNQGSDIHQVPWPTVRINLERGSSEALFFVSASIRHCLSHIHTSLFALYQCLPIFFFLFISLAVCFPISPPPCPLCFSFAHVYHQAVMNQHSYWVGGKGQEAHSLVLGVGVIKYRKLTTVGQIDVLQEL